MIHHLNEASPVLSRQKHSLPMTAGKAASWVAGIDEHITCRRFTSLTQKYDETNPSVRIFAIR